MKAPAHRRGRAASPWGAAAAGLLALVLGACATPPPAPPPEPPAKAKPMPVTELPPVPPKRATPPPPRPQVLMGLDEAAVAKLIGKPAFKRADDPAAIWRYQAGDCVLDLYLHNEGRAARVVHYEFRPGEDSKVVDPAGCMARLSARRAERKG